MSANRGVGLFVVGIFLAALSAEAATFVVDDVGPGGDISPGDGVCENSVGTCTYEAATSEASALAGSDTIQMPAGTWGGSLYVTDDLTIVGVGGTTSAATIFDGGNSVQPFRTTTADLTLVGVVVQNGRAVNVGGGVTTSSGHLTIVNSEIRNNVAGNVGGGVHSDSAVTIVNSLLVGNRSGNTGGALHVHGPTRVSGTTFFDNRSGNTGGTMSAKGLIELVDVTITGNAGRAALRASEGGRITIENSILWGNDGECSYGSNSSIKSLGNNLFDADVCELSTGFAATDLVGISPVLGPLQDNGGPTHTMALLPGSPAIDTGNTSCEPFDQRGLPRPLGASCDIGAFEKIACNYDGIVDSDEQCDDGNTADGDGCSSLCESELLTGRQLTLRRGGSGTAKLILKSKDPRIRVGWGNFSGDDPVIHGGTVRVASETGDFDLVIDLPAEHWDYIGKPGANRGYRYKDKAGTIRSVQLRPGKSLKVKGDGLSLGLDLDPNPVHAFVSVGSRVHCASFGGSMSFKQQRSYRAKNAPRPFEAPDL